MKNKYYAIGIMSGSSLDGLDIAFCSFSFDKTWSFEIIYTKDYSIECWKERLKNARELSSEKLDLLDLAFGGFIAEKVSEFMEEFSISDVDIIASHGHTIYHFPEKGITKQIGLGKQIFDKLQIPTLTNLRQKDIDFGGSGAPIVPIGDLHLFSEYKYCLNIGGIANISIKTPNEIIAFDICSANQVLNYFAFLKGNPYDDNGDLARKGTLNKILFDSLNTLDYYKKTHPKSLDNLFTKKVLKHFKNTDISVEDKLNTYCEHIAFQISESILNNTSIQEKNTSNPNRLLHSQPESFTQARSLIRNDDSILITGGGAFNSFLMERISFYLAKQDIKTVIPNSEIINYKEALVMAFMGVLYLRNEVNCLRSVTGASEDSICGEIFNYTKTKGLSKL